MAVHKRNLHEIGKVVEIYKRFGAKYLYLNPVAPYGRAKENMIDLLLDKADLRALAYRYIWAVSQEGVHSGNAYWQTLAESAFLNDNFSPFEHCMSNMSIGASVISINSKGDVYLDSKMKSERLLCLGNVKTKPLMEMWKDARLERLRAKFEGGLGAFISHTEVLNTATLPILQ
jgi:MoaA/NifB/PqqE/SkfB family radical SAM enzyme